MPKILRARAAQDEKEERWVRKLAASRHGPADWILHARMVAKSWDGQRVEAIARGLDCSPQTVRRRLHRFDAEGIEGLGDRPKSGRRRRLTVTDDSKIIALVHQAPPGRLVTQEDGSLVARDEQGSAQWSLNALAQAAKEAGIRVKRSQIRRILLREGVRWRQTHSWGTPRDKDFVPKGPRSSSTTLSPRRDRQACAFLGGPLQALFDAGARDDRSAVAEAHLGPERPLLVPEAVESRVDAADLLANLGVVLAGERVPELDSLLAQALDLLMDLTDRSHAFKNAGSGSRIPGGFLRKTRARRGGPRRARSSGRARGGR